VRGIPAANKDAEYMSANRTLHQVDRPEASIYVLVCLSREYREIFFKPYRIIYRIVAERVYVTVIADGRRDMQTLLQRRLFQA
jgi:toxin ParE1/3/4